MSSLEGSCVIALSVPSLNFNFSFFHRHEVSFVGAANAIHSVITSYSHGVFKSLLLLLIFAPDIISGGSLSLGAYLVVLSLLDPLRRTFVSFFSRALLFATECHVAVVRIQVNIALYILCVLKNVYKGEC